MTFDALIAKAVSAYELTEAELAILTLTARGLSREQIAIKRNVLRSTIKKQASGICVKTGAPTVAMAAIRALGVLLAEVVVAVDREGPAG